MLGQQMWDLSRAESLEEAAQQIANDVGGSATFVARVTTLAEDLKGQSDLDRVSELAVFAYCEARGLRPMPA